MHALRFRRTALAVATAAVLPFALTACSEDAKSSDAAPSASASADGANPDTASSDPAMAMDKPFGAACAGVPAEGAGSFDGMA
ncbi:fasciclin domain-containing protein, partial [Streptomyces subrutilus]